MSEEYQTSQKQSQSFFSRFFSREEKEEEPTISKVLVETQESYQRELSALGTQAVEVSTLRYQSTDQPVQLKEGMKHGTRWQSDKKAERSKSARNAAAQTQKEEDEARAAQIFFVMRSRNWDTGEERVNRNLLQNEHTAVYQSIAGRQDVTGYDRRSHMKGQKKKIDLKDVEADARNLFENFRLDLVLDGEVPYDPSMQKILNVYSANYALVNPALAEIGDEIDSLKKDPANADEVDALSGQKHNIEDFSYPLMNLGLQNSARLEQYHRDVIACDLAIGQVQKEMQEIDPCPYGAKLIEALQARKDEAQREMDVLRQEAVDYISKPERKDYYDYMESFAIRLRNAPKDEDDPERVQLLREGIDWYKRLPIMSPAGRAADRSGTE